MTKILSTTLLVLSLIASVFFSVKLIQLYQHEHNMAIKQVAHIKAKLLKVYAANQQLAPEALVHKFLAIEYQENIALMILDNHGAIVASPNRKFIGLPVTTFSRISPKITAYIRGFLHQQQEENIQVVHDLDSNLVIVSAIWHLDATHSLLMIKKKSTKGYFQFLNSKQHLLFALTLSLGLLILVIITLCLTKFLSGKIMLIVQVVFFCILALTLLIQLILLRTPQLLPSTYQPLFGNTQVQALLDREQRQHDRKLLLPFGVYITNLSFPADSVIRLSMWIWSKKQTLPGGEPIKILLTQEIQGRMVPIKSVTDNKMFRISDATLKQEFSQTRYPFDDRYVILEFWHTDMFNPDILIYPDINSYNLSNPTDLLTPQLDPNLRIKDWNILESFYVSAPLESNSELGNPHGTISKLSDRIMLVILLRRDFTGPLMKFFLPLLVVLVMYYIGLLLMRDETIFWTLTYNASLLFVITLAASHARQYVATNNISFIEVMYIILYSAIVLFSLLQLGHTYMRRDGSMINIHDILKFIYWPAVLIAILVNTLMYFW